VLLFVLVALLPAAPASAAFGEGDGMFDDAAGTRTLVWHNGELREEIHVVATARRESEPWYPCGGYVYPGGTLDIRMVPLLGPVGGFFDANGKLLYNCGPAPSFVPVLPQWLEVEYTSCKAKDLGGSKADTDYTNTTPMVVGGRTVEEQRVDDTDLGYTFLGDDAPEKFCITEFVTGSRPAKWCSPGGVENEFCPREYGSGNIPLQEGTLRYLPTPTPGCAMAAKSERKIRKELKQLAARLRTRTRGRWWLESRFDSRREFYDYVAKPRAVANCR